MGAPRPGLAVHRLSLREAGRRLREGTLSPLALVQSCLDRIAQHDARLCCFITVTAEQAQAQAVQVQQLLRQGHDLGPLMGMPVAHKDMLATRGVRTTAGSATLQDWVPDEDAAVVAQLARAGAISLGKTHCHEFAFGSPVAGDTFPPARNPWNLAHMPGSSSSGSGAAVAAALVLAATGTDTGGSVRHPAAACGVVGLKPSRDRVALAGVLPLAPSLDQVGPLTRNVPDAALMLAAMQKPGWGGPAPDALLGQDIHGCRIGVPWKAIEAEPHHPEVLSAFEAALRVLEGLGARIEALDTAQVQGWGAAAELTSQLIAHEAWQVHRERLALSPQLLGQGLRLRLARAPQWDGPAHQAALAQARALAAQLDGLLRRNLDLVLTPGREFPAETLDELMAQPTGKRSTCNRLWSLTGLPAITLPMGMSRDGLPLALQMAAAWGEDARLLQAAAAYESATGWHLLHPLD